MPAKAAYGIVGRSRVVQTAGKGQVVFRHRSTKAVAMAGRASGWLAEALRNIGQRHIAEVKLDRFKAALGPKQKRELLTDLRYAPAWMRPFFLEVARDE